MNRKKYRRKQKLRQRRKKTIESIANGPFRSRLEQKVYARICRKLGCKEMDMKIEINKTGLVKKNQRLELDLYIPDRNLGIEVQGPIHHINPHRMLKDHSKKRVFEAVGIDIVYIYTHSNEQMNMCIDRCVEIIKRRNKKKEYE